MRFLLLDALKRLQDHRRSLLAFYLIFTGASLILLTPLASTGVAALRPVTGDAAITTGGLLSFLASPGGVLWALATAMVTVFLLLLQQAGITLIANDPVDHSLRASLRALTGVTRRLPALVRLAVIQTLAHALLATPFLIALGIGASVLLNHYDPYLLSQQQPPALWLFLAYALLIIAGLLAANGTLFLRWILSVPCLVMERLPARQALAESSRRSHGIRRATAGALSVGVLLTLASPVIGALVVEAFAAALLGLLPANTALLVPMVTGLVALYLLVSLTLAFLASSTFGTLVVGLYQRTGGRFRSQTLLYQPTASARAWWLEALVLVMVLIQGGLVVASLDQKDDVTVTAHRGSAFDAPENTLAAIEQAIADGADYVEIDAQLTADGVVVLWHDSDMMRVFGRPERISEVNYNDIRDLDAGSWFSPVFADQTIPTLQDAIEAVQGKARLFVDLKPYRNDEQLLDAVVSELKAANAVSGTVLAAADWGILERAKEQAPALKTALLAQFIVGPHWQDRYDILGLRFNRATSAAVARAHQAGNELHVWTVNQRADMERFLDMGVDNIITDRPAVLTELLKERAQRTNGERLAMQIRNWLR